MDYFYSIKDSDIFENPSSEPKEYVDRPTVKGIVIDVEGRIALLRAATRSLFPGGGIEDGETNEEALIRECKEEIGCEVEIVRSLGKALNLRNKDAKKYEVEFFVAYVIGEKGSPVTTQEDEVGLPIDWLTKEDVHELLRIQIENLSDEVYAPHFNCRTHLAAFEKYLEKNHKFA